MDASDRPDEALNVAPWKELRDAVVALVRATAALALAEGRLAVASSVSMIAIAVLGAGTLFVAWLMLMLALVFGAAELGVPLWIACGALGLLHIVLAVGLWLTARRLARHLEFPNTRRAIAESWTTHLPAEQPTP